MGVCFVWDYSTSGYNWAGDYARCQHQEKKDDRYNYIIAHVDSNNSCPCCNNVCSWIYDVIVSQKAVPKQTAIICSRMLPVISFKSTQGIS